MEALDIIKTRVDSILPMLDDRQRRIYLVSETRGVARCTITRGAIGRIRKAGGGRNKVIDLRPGIVREIERIVNSHTMSDPMNPLFWTSRSTSSQKSI